MGEPDAPCALLREEIAWLRGTTPRRRLVREHLDGCARCAGFSEEVRRQHELLAALLPVAPGAGLKRAVLRAAPVSRGGT